VNRKFASLRLPVLCIFLAILVCLAHPALQAQTKSTSARSKAWSVSWQPARLVNGSPVLFRVAPPASLRSLSAEWLEHEISFSFDPAKKAWYALAGVSLQTKPTAHSLRLKATTTQGREIAFERTVTVRRERYPSIAVTVAPKFTAPSPQQLEEINRDKAVKQEIFSHAPGEREWKGRFAAPVEARISDVFGTRRVFNGETQSLHQGLDYAVPQGTPVRALNAGTVLLARPMFFEGNWVVLDHGQGLLSLYLHLSEFKVKEGEQVSRGQEIGLSGGTGRATGPHLHIAVRWQGVYVNPATLLKLNLP
jgi:murein DD-endopeptidase MepM/ murein hydrolase activator NlpD